VVARPMPRPAGRWSAVSPIQFISIIFFGSACLLILSSSRQDGGDRLASRVPVVLLQNAHMSSSQQAWQELFPVAHNGHKVTSLSDAAPAQGTDSAQPEEETADSDKRWGYWRTPHNSNQYEGMKSPVENNNPLGEHVLFRDSDRTVNIRYLMSE
jgi:hypothetical protein